MRTIPKINDMRASLEKQRGRFCDKINIVMMTILTEGVDKGSHYGV